MTAWSILETGADETFDGKVVTLGHSGTRSPSRAGFFAPACFYTPAFVALLATSAFCATISGRVSESSTDLPIPGAVVRVQSSSSLTRFTLSDSTGAFAFDGLERGDWMLSAEMVGYRPWRRAISLDEESSVVAVQLETQPLRMEPMVVWAQRGGEDRHTPAYVGTIPIETLQAPGADLAQALDVATNVNVRRYGGLGSFSTLSIRGSTSEQVQVYLDGVLLNQALGGGVNLGNLPLARSRKCPDIPGRNARPVRRQQPWRCRAPAHEFPVAIEENVCPHDRRFLRNASLGRVRGRALARLGIPGIGQSQYERE